MARVLHLIAANHRRGAETFAVELAEHLRSAGHELRVMAVSDVEPQEPLDVEVAGRTRWDPRGWTRVWTAARWADVVVAFGSTSLLIGAAASKVTHTPFVYRTIGDPTVWGDVRGAGLRVGLPARSARVVVALFPAAGDALVQRYGLSRSSVRVIPRGVPQHRFTPADARRRAAAHEELGLDAGHRWVAYVGALSAEKDPLLAVDAVARAPKRLGLLMVGDGPLRGDVERAAQRVGARVRVLGPRDDVRPVYDAADALVLPSHTEGIPGAAIEAALSGLPVVSFPVGGVPSVVVSGRTGILVDSRNPASVAEALEIAVDRRAEWGMAGRQRCLEMFSMESVGAAWERVVADVSALGQPPVEGR